MREEKIFQDDWGRDPTVQMMRRIFSRMEEAQAHLIQSCSISPFDPRLRKVRNQAREIFEEAWPTALQKGVISSDQQTIFLYVSCLKYALKKNGFVLPAENEPGDERIDQYLKEILR